MPVRLMLAATLALLSPLATSPGNAAQQPIAVFERADGERAVSELASALEGDFVLPEVGKKYAAMLRTKLAAGRYSNAEDAKEFTDAVNADLQAVHKDGHLRLHYVPAEYRKPKGAVAGGDQAPAGTSDKGPPEKSSVATAGWLADGVAYIDFAHLPGNEPTLADVRKFIAAHEHAKVVIIDARRVAGGGLAEMNLLFAQLFAEPKVLAVLDIRKAVEDKHGSLFGVESKSLLRKVAGPEAIIRREHLVVPAAQQSALNAAKVYLLTSRNTLSAAEHLSLALKRTKRATLVGETTGGAGHFGGMSPMGEAYAAFIPAGRTFDPDTGQSWEGTGIEPDVKVPADKALDEALKLAGVTASGATALAQLK